MYNLSMEYSEICMLFSNRFSLGELHLRIKGCLTSECYREERGGVFVGSPEILNK